jgi:hypothetical protein
VAADPDQFLVGFLGPELGEELPYFVIMSEL